MTSSCACAASCAAACGARTRLRRERGLLPLLLRAHPGDLVLDGREKLVLLGELRLDGLLLRGLLGDDPRLVGSRVLQRLRAASRPPSGTVLTVRRICESWLETRSIASSRAMMSSRLDDPRITSSVESPSPLM